MNNRAIYALYSNNQFVSWLYGAFCQLTSTPKFYWCGENHQRQTEVILENLKYKFENINKDSSFGQLLGIPSDNPIDNSQNRDAAILTKLNGFSLGVFFVNEESTTKETLEELAKNGTPATVYHNLI